MCKQCFAIGPKEYYKQNCETLKIKKNKYAKNNREKINTRYNHRIQNDPTFELSENLRNRTRKTFKEHNVRKNI